MDNNLVNEIKTLYDEGRNEEIIRIIEALPDEDKEYNLLIMLARAYYDITSDTDNVYLEKALNILKSIRKDGESDLAWLYLIAKTYFNLNQEETAIEYFEYIHRLECKDRDLPDNIFASHFIKSCRKYMRKKAMDVIRKNLCDYFGDITECDDENISIKLKSDHLSLCITIEKIRKNEFEGLFVTESDSGETYSEKINGCGCALDSAVKDAIYKYILFIGDKTAFTEKQ